MTIAAACAPPGGGRNPVTPRFLRHFGMLCLPSPSDFNLKTIFLVNLKNFWSFHVFYHWYFAVRATIVTADNILNAVM